MERRKTAADRRKLLESCLVLIRATYTNQPGTFDDFLKEHPTNDKSTLQSKIMSQMMIKCKGEITPAQVAGIQKYRVKVAQFKDTSKVRHLVDIDWDGLRHKPEPEVTKVEDKPTEDEKAPKSDVQDDDEKDSLEEEADVESMDEPVKPKAAEAPKPEVKVSLTQDEKMMATEIEDISEDLHAEQVVSNR